MAAPERRAVIHQTLDGFERQYQPQRHADFEQVFLAFSDPGRDVAPRRLVPVLRRQVLLDQIPHVGEVESFMMVGIVKGRGKRRDQFGAGNGVGSSRERNGTAVDIIITPGMGESSLTAAAIGAARERGKWPISRTSQTTSCARNVTWR
jgi:hypothetical protein